MTMTPGDGNTVAPQITDSGPGPMDVLEARATLADHHAHEQAEGAVARLRAFLDRSPAPTAAEVAREGRRLIESIEHALTVSRTIRSLGIGDEL